MQAHARHRERLRPAMKLAYNTLSKKSMMPGRKDHQSRRPRTGTSASMLSTRRVGKTGG